MNVVDIALAKKFTKDTADGLGAIKGANCTISNKEEFTDRTELTFKWTGNSGAVQTQKVTVKNAPTIVGISITQDKKLAITDSKGNTFVTEETLDVSSNASDVTYTNSNFPTLNTAKKAFDELLDKKINSAADVSYTNSNSPTLNTVKKALDELLTKKVGSAADVSYTNENNNTITNVKEALDIALAGGAVLQQDLTVSNPIGSATNGRKYNKDTSIEKILRDILIKEVAPGLSFSINPNKILYNKATETVSSLSLIANISKNTYDVSKVEFYKDSTKIDTQQTNTNGGNYSKSLTFEPTNINFTVKAKVYDKREGSPMTTEKSITIKFIGEKYYGTAGSNVGEPTANQITGLSEKALQDTNKLTYKGITMEYGRVVYAYPTDFGALTSIRDIPHNIDYTNSFTRTTVQIGNISYYCYTQTEPSAANNIEITFA